MRTRKFIGLAVVPTSLFTTMVLGGSMAFAQSSASNSAHALPTLSVIPYANLQVVKPDAPLTIAIDTSSPNWARFREQFVKNRFVITINNGATVQNASFDPSTGTIKVNHATLARDTTYTGTLSVKADANGNTVSGNASETFTFETGSAIGDATQVSARVERTTVSVDSGGILDVTATDDYGDPSTNGTVSVIGTGNFESSAGTISNGLAKITLQDKTAEDVTLTYTVTDSNGDKVTGEAVDEAFVPGTPARISLAAANNSPTAGTDDVITGKVYDQYGNLATNDTDSASVSVNGGPPVSAQISDGTFIYTLAAANDHIAGPYAVSATDGSATGSTSVQVVPAAPANVSLGAASPTVVAGGADAFTGTVTDKYGNNVVDGTNVTITSSGGASTQLATTDGTFTYTPTDDTTTGTYKLTAAAGGATGTASVTVTPGAPYPGTSTVTFPSTSIVAGTNYTVSGTVRDQYGNVIPNQNVSLNFDNKSNSTTSGNDGSFSVSVQPASVTTTTATVSAGSVTLATHSGTVTPVTPIQLSLSMNDNGYSNFDRGVHENYWINLPSSALSVSSGGQSVPFRAIPTSGNNNEYIGSPLPLTVDASAGYSKLWLLEDGVNGNQSDYVTITYADGSQTTEWFNAPDWMVPGSYPNMYTAWSGTAYETYYSQYRSADIFATYVSVDSSKVVKSITFGSNYNIALWGVTLN